VPNVGFALVRLNPNVADKLRTLQKRGVAYVALGPAPNVALVVCALTHETDVAYVALGPAPNVELVGCALTYETDVAYVALGPVPNVELVRLCTEKHACLRRCGCGFLPSEMLNVAGCLF